MRNSKILFFILRINFNPENFKKPEPNYAVIHEKGLVPKDLFKDSIKENLKLIKNKSRNNKINNKVNKIENEKKSQQNFFKNDISLKM